MIRTILAITKRQKSWLETQARFLGISQTELIRRLIDAEMEKTQE